MHPFQRYLSRWLSPFFEGHNYHCNVCGFNARQLKTRGHSHPTIAAKKIQSAGKRMSDCPKCLSSDRDRRFWQFFEPQIKNNISILHVAPEYPLSMAIKLMQKNHQINYQCIDKRTNGYYYPKWVKNGDITALDFPSKHFDWVIANHVLEHILDLETALNEVKRVLKPKGKAVFMVPMSANQPTHHGTVKINDKFVCQLSEIERIEQFGQHDHVRLFGTDITRIFSGFGWDMELINCVESTKSDNPMNLGLFEGESIPVASPIILL